MHSGLTKPIALSSDESFKRQIQTNKKPRWVRHHRCTIHHSANAFPQQEKTALNRADTLAIMIHPLTVFFHSCPRIRQAWKCLRHERYSWCCHPPEAHQRNNGSKVEITGEAGPGRRTFYGAHMTRSDETWSTVKMRLPSGRLRERERLETKWHIQQSVWPICWFYLLFLFFYLVKNNLVWYFCFTVDYYYKTKLAKRNIKCGSRRPE